MNKESPIVAARALALELHIPSKAGGVFVDYTLESPRILVAVSPDWKGRDFIPESYLGFEVIVDLPYRGLAYG